MKKSKLILLTRFIIVTASFGQTNEAAFFRISSPSNAVITELDPPEGMVLVPGGTNCGTNPLAYEEGERYSPSYPSNYCLSVSAFYMDATEVTKAQWDAVYTWATNNSYGFDNAGSGKALDHPVQTVNWYDCVKWCNARSEMEGRTPCYMVGTNVYRTGQSTPDCDLEVAGYRLPTSEEWEMAARGGLKNKRFSWGDTITHSNANYCVTRRYSYDELSPNWGVHPDYYDKTSPWTSPAGSFAANGYGLYDMVGNVLELCTDIDSEYSVLRGGCWLETGTNCRTGYTGLRVDISRAGNTFGFRAVLPAN